MGLILATVGRALPDGESHFDVISITFRVAHKECRNQKGSLEISRDGFVWDPR